MLDRLLPAVEDHHVDIVAVFGRIVSNKIRRQMETKLR